MHKTQQTSLIQQNKFKKTLKDCWENIKLANQMQSLDKKKSGIEKQVKKALEAIADLKGQSYINERNSRSSKTITSRHSRTSIILLLIKFKRFKRM